MLIYAQANRSPYTAVSVLLVRWEDDMTFEQDLMLLQQVFRERFHYRTETYTIPTCPNPSMKLTVQMAQHLEFSRPDHLWVVYYAGYGFVGSDHNLYWAWYEFISVSLTQLTDIAIATIEKTHVNSSGMV